MNKHVYIFDYSTGSIFHTKLPDTIAYPSDIDLMDYFGLNSDECYYMITDKELKIEEL